MLLSIENQFSGIQQTLEEVVVPHISSPYVRGQVIAVMEILNQMQNWVEYRSDLLEDEEILTDVQEHAADLEQACQALVDRANHKGGDDNVTTLLIRAQAGDASPRPRSAKGGAVRPTTSAGGAGGRTVGRGGVLGWLKRVFRG